MPAARRPSDGDLVLGLDFGTTNSAVAVVQDGVVDVLVNDVGNRLTPSCVHVDADQARQVGEGALRMAVSDPGNTVRNVKRVLGLPVEAVRQASGLLGTVRVGNSNDGSGGAVLVLGDGTGPHLAAEEVVAALLHELKKAAEAQLGRGASGAVIAVPTYFNAAQRHAVRDAGQLAGLEVLRLVNEPTAAAVAYAYDKEFTKTIVVVDVGGGGSSISVLRVENNKITVLASSMARLPGGEDFDQKMVEYLREVIRERHGRAVEDARSLELLRTHWEKAKQRLSRIPVAKIATFLPDAGLEFEHEVKRADMDRCAPLFHEITAAMKSVLEAAKTPPEAVDDVLLVGGSTRIPRLRDLVQEALGGKRLCKAVHQDEEVSKGAALLGAGLCTVRDLTPLHLSVLINGEEFTVLPNTPLPHTLDLRGQGQGPGQAMVRQGPWVPSGLQGDGDMPMTSIFELTKKSRVAFARLLLDESGLVHLLDACGFLLHVVPRSCLSEQKLRDLQGKHEAHQREQDMEQCRMEEKNALEDKCRTLMAVQVSDDDPDARHILALKQKCQEGLEWLQNNDDAHLQDVKGKLTEIARLEDEVHARQADRRAREAEIQRVEARESLMELCRDVRDMQVPDGDSDAAALWQECVHILHMLRDNPGVALADIDLKTATVVEKRGDLEEKRAAQERAVRERTAAAPSRSYAFAASQPPRGVRQADQEWLRGSDPKASHPSGRDNWQGERVDQPQNFLRNYRNMGVFSGSSHDSGTLRRVEEGSFSRYPNKKRKWLDGCTIV